MISFGQNHQVPRHHLKLFFVSNHSTHI